MKNFYAGAVLAVSAALSGCGNLYVKWEEKPETPPGIYSRQVTFKPYTIQGVDVRETTSWFYGNNEGVTAYAARTGVVYVVDPADGASGSDGSPAVAAECASSPAGSGASASVGESADSSLKNFENAIAQASAGGQHSCPSSAYQRLGHFGEGSIPGELDLIVNFPSNSDQEMYKESATDFAQWLEKTASQADQILQLVVVGYTDDVGLDDVNIPLSARRAANVASAVKAVMKDTEVLEIGSGPAPRLADNRIGGGRKTNRRVEIYVVKKGEPNE